MALTDASKDPDDPQSDLYDVDNEDTIWQVGM